MTWAEFQIRLFSLNRQNESEKQKLSVLASTMINTALIDGNSKKQLQKDLSLMLFGESKPVVTDAQLEAIRKAQENYLNRVKK